MYDKSLGLKKHIRQQFCGPLLNSRGKLDEMNWSREKETLHGEIFQAFWRFAWVYNALESIEGKFYNNCVSIGFDEHADSNKHFKLGNSDSQRSQLQI